MKERRLLFTLTKKDFRIEYFSGSGAGGQHRNRHKNCVRIHHPASGAIVTGQSHKERKSNFKEAFHKLPQNGKFKVWHTKKCNELLTGKTIDQLVDEAMEPQNLKIETKNEKDQWTLEGESNV